MIAICLAVMPCSAWARHRILSADVKSLEVRVNDDWMKLVPMMTLGSHDRLTVSFDELSHVYHRYVYVVEHCEPDWTPTEGIFESDWLEGFNRLPIEDYENSLNTNVLYTHYKLTLPNDQMRLKMSGNYRLHVLDEDEDEEEVLTVEFHVVEPVINVGLGITSNTDVELNGRYQQVDMTVNYNELRVTNLEEQIQTFVMQNGREEGMRSNPRPNFINQKGLKWEHNRELIFEAGNEFHKFEVLNPNHTTMGLANVAWVQDERRYHVFPYICEEQRNYIYDRDADGAFILRNSDNYESECTSEYVFVHYKLMAPRPYEGTRVFIDGAWTTEDRENYVMSYNAAEGAYNAVVLQKLGYYNYQLLMEDAQGVVSLVPEEGSFFQTENRYEALVYYKGIGERTWRLVGYQEVVSRVP